LGTTKRIEFIRPAEDRRVPPDYHITYDRVKYSVPAKLVDKIVSVKASSKNIEICYDGHPVAIHSRSYKQADRVTIDAHVHQNHKAYNSMHFDDWVSHMKQDTRTVVEATLEVAKAQRNRPVFMNRVRCIIRDYGDERFDLACTQAVLNGSPSLHHVTNLLKNNLEGRVIQLKPQTPAKIKPQKNVRGADYYKRGLGKKGDKK